MYTYVLIAQLRLHDHAARLQLPDYPRQELLDQLLNLIIALLLLLLTMVLLLASILLLALLLLVTAAPRMSTTSVIPALITARLLWQSWRRADLPAS